MHAYPSYTSCGDTVPYKTVYPEIERGMRFRKQAKKEREKLRKNCTGKTKKRGNEEEFNPCAKLDVLFAELNADGKKQYADPFKVIRMEEKLARKRAKKSKEKTEKKQKIVDRDTLTHRQHIDLLSKPRKLPQNPAYVNMGTCQQEVQERTKKKKQRKRQVRDDASLSPRLKQLAMPSKRLVHATWCQYRNVLDAGTVVRMENILLAAGNGRNLEPREAAKYFRDEAKRKKKPKVSKRQKCREDAEKKWLKNEIYLLADYIVHSIAKNPLQPERYRHMQLTTVLVATLRVKGYRIEPINRNTKSFRKRTILEILDHVSVWADRIFLQAEVVEMKLNVKRLD